MDNDLWRWVWVIAALIMGLGEIFTAGFFLLPFGIGAVLAAIAAWLDLHGAVQWLLFFGGTGVSFLVLRRFMGHQDQPDDLPVGANRYIGLSARVVEAIDTVNNTGRIRVESDEWRAISSAGPIEEGSLVRVTALVGTKLEVTIEEPPPADYVPLAARGNDDGANEAAAEPDGTDAASDGDADPDSQQPPSADDPTPRND